MKKVVIFEFFTGNIAGAQKVTLNIIPMLKKTYDVVIFQRQNNTLYSDTVKEFGETKRIPCESLFTKVFGTGRFEGTKKTLMDKIYFILNVLFFNVFSLFHVIKEKPDYTYTYDPRGFVLSCLLLKLTKTKVIWHLHSKLSCSDKISKIMMSFVDEIIVPSQNIKDSLPADDKVKVIYNGFDLKREIAKNPVADELNLSFVGSLVAHKGLHNILLALKDIDHSNVKLHVYGSYAHSNPLLNYEDYISSIISENALQDKVIFHGWCSNVIPEIMKSDLLIFPSVINQTLSFKGETMKVNSSEALPTIVIEALSVETPVVAVNTPGISEIVVEKSDGIIIDESEPSLIANAVNEIIANQKSYCPDSKLIINKFSLEEMQQHIYDTFN
ncbi:Spore coat protein SA [Photobacterium malacitanum]|uniref:Spore coat protein SA n=1 Tax=Photobacterium malacitanum TaxID=2204294 RepID=A0A1Y6M9I8_9GAMM|nr:glycosyltransferase family 4 protein [Photobacterium malacitanum]SMY33253.1 Spore coat protein SA [Photobacterium malacitanum]